MAVNGLQLRNERVELGFRNVSLGIWDICICTAHHASLYSEFSSSVLRMKNVTCLFAQLRYTCVPHWEGRQELDWELWFHFSTRL